jgi:CO/xanthine dehydrogenase FAD-binding subunit
VVKAEEAILRKAVNDFDAEATAEAAVSAANPLKHNGYIIQIAKTMVKRAILACMVF